MEPILGEGYERGPMQGRTIIGEVTESLHRFLLEGWNLEGAPPRIEEDLSFVPKDREEVVYVYMYKANQNAALMNSKRYRLAKFDLPGGEKDTYWERAPLYLELHYLIAVHSRFRSDAERLFGWVLLRLHEATHLVYRPRRYTLPDGRQIDSRGHLWDPESFDEDTIMEKVSLALCDDLTVGDAINFFTINEAPFRPYLTYKARCAMEGSLISGPPGPVEVDYSMSDRPMAPGDVEPTADDSGDRSSERTGRARGRLPAAPVRRSTHVEPNSDDN